MYDVTTCTGHFTQWARYNKGTNRGRRLDLFFVHRSQCKHLYTEILDSIGFPTSDHTGIALHFNSNFGEFTPGLADHDAITLDETFEEEEWAFEEEALGEGVSEADARIFGLDLDSNLVDLNKQTNLDQPPPPPPTESEGSGSSGESSSGHDVPGEPNSP